MFKKYIIDTKTDKYHVYKHQVLIIDDNFEKNIMIGGYYNFYDKLCYSIIKIYSEKQLDIAKNLFLFMMYVENKEFYKIKTQIHMFSINVNNFKDYLPEIKKHLLFT